MAEKEYSIPRERPAVAPGAEERVREKVRGMPSVVAKSLFEDPEFQVVMNRWMIGTHLIWGFTLAVTFIGLNYTLIWLNPPAWVVSTTMTPLGVGYLAWQWRKFRKRKVQS